MWPEMSANWAGWTMRMGIPSRRTSEVHSDVLSDHGFSVNFFLEFKMRNDVRWPLMVDPRLWQGKTLESMGLFVVGRNIDRNLNLRGKALFIQCIIYYLSSCRTPPDCVLALPGGIFTKVTSDPE
jgi:hypothetical protein